MKEPIRVLHILQRMEAAGIQTFLMNIYRIIDREKVQFDFLVHYKEDEFYDEEIRMLGGCIYKFSVREDYNIVKYRKEIKKFFGEHKEYHIIHAHMETLSNIWEVEAKKAGMKAIISHAHTAGYNQKNVIKLMIKNYYKKNYGKYSNKLFACSNAAGQFMFQNRKYEVVPNAIDVSKFEFSEEYRKYRKSLEIQDELVIGHVGRFHPSKNHMFLLDIAEYLMKKHYKIKLLLVGDGEIKQQIENEVKKRKLEDVVTMVGNRDDVNVLYSVMDIFVMPSMFEGLPLVGVEAQAAGLASLFSNTITKELQLTDVAEFMDLEYGVEAWATKIIEMSKETIDRKKYAMIIGEKGYDIKMLTDKLVNIYEELY